MEAFSDEGQELIKKGKGIQPSSLGKLWGELARIVQNYITYGGCKDLVRPLQLKILVVLKQKCSVNFPELLNSLLHDIAKRLRQSQHIETVVSCHYLIKLIVSHNLSQQQSTWGDLILALERGEDLPAPNIVPKRKRTSLSQRIPHKHRRSTKLKSKQGVSENPQGNASQPIELSSPVNEQDLQLESGGKDNPKTEPKEGVGNSKDD